MEFLIFIVFIIFVFFFFFSFSHLRKSRKTILNFFKRGSVIVFGKKGTGKDLLFQYVVNSRKKPYLSNISYGGKYTHIDIKDLDLKNTYLDFINGKIQKTNKLLDREGKDVYLSDCGIHLPSQYDSSLHKIFPSFSVYYALSRQTYNQNIHCNTQALDRVWKALREQADYYIKCNRSFRIFNIFIISYTAYDKYSSAKAELLPMKKKMFSSKELKARIEQYNATNGLIKNGLLFISHQHIKYDTRAFEKIVFN